MKRILIIGATSAIATATARLWAAQGHRLFLAGRDRERLEALAADLKIRGAAKADYGLLDATDLSRHAEVIETAEKALGGLDWAFIAHGSLPDQKACEADFALALAELTTNAVSVLSLLTLLANRLEAKGGGAVGVITSVAGDRGRQSNYVYGTAKGAVSIFLQGLRQRLAKKGVQVLDVRPGFVDTPMTRDFRKGLLWARPEAIAKAIDKGFAKGGDVVYAPGFWRLIMFIIRAIPEAVFKKLSL